MVDVDKDMVDMDMVNRKFLVNFIYLGHLPRVEDKPAKVDWCSSIVVTGG